MKKTLLFLLTALSLIAMLGCSGGSDDGGSNVNQDLKTGAAPTGIDGAAPQSNGGADAAGGGGVSTPSSTP